ncbi:tumor necrosis factor receptor superfamily member 6B-like [Ptychodera flava]|uniref:tumor necrosis factor receptor superfamily member 6B-like n=1 Tax=Ptychodera flava TaxID=63121 RepID=UPI00396A49A4
MTFVAMTMQPPWQKITLMVAVTSYLATVESGKCYKEEKTTFERNGRTCDVCRPGTYMVKPCTEDAPSRCQKVPNGSYMPYFNKCTRVIVVQLWPCNRPCYGRFEVTLQNCTAVSRGKCGCIEGTYKTPGEGRCIAHDCSPGTWYQ